ncbi:oxidoreductase, partial [Roseomonas sp. BU-1]|nr:oxidoreductase [Falsiroseomonas selenitidurans]
AAAVDVLGGATLARLSGGTQRGGTVVALGDVRGRALHTGLAPFIRRGVTLVGLDMREAVQSRRAAGWARWAERGPAGLDAVIQRVALDAAPDAARALLDGRMQGRAVLRLGAPR